LNESTILVLRGHRVYEDSHGNVCLDDLWRAAKAGAGKVPSKWRNTRMAKALRLLFARGPTRVLMGGCNHARMRCSGKRCFIVGSAILRIVVIVH